MQHHLDDGMLHALVDGEIASDQLEPIRTHLDGCAECRLRLDQTRALAGEAASLVEAMEVPAGPTDRRMGGPTTGRTGRRARRWVSMRSLAWAASIAVAAGLGYFGGQPRGNGMTGRTAAPPGADDARSREPQSGDRIAGAVSAESDRADALPSEAAARSEVAARSEAAFRDDRPPGKPPAPEAAPPVGRVDTGAAAKTLASEAKREEAARAGALAAPVPRTPTEVLEQAVVTGRRVAALRSDEAQAQPQQALAEVVRPARDRNALEAEGAEFAPVTWVEALRLLGGRLRLVDGLVPERVEASGSSVRVVYRLADGELQLEQRREGDSIAVVRLSGPTSIGADSLARLWDKIR